MSCWHSGFLWGTVFTVLTLTGTLSAAEVPAADVTLELDSLRGKRAMVVVWLEDSQGKFIKTLKVNSRTPKYYKEMSVWRAASKGESREDLDAVVGATIKWGEKSSFKLPLLLGDRKLLDGGYVMRLESGREDGRHYRDFRIPIEKDFKGGVFKDAGYVASVTIRLPGAAPREQPAP